MSANISPLNCKRSRDIKQIVLKTFIKTCSSSHQCIVYCNKNIIENPEKTDV